MIKTVLFDLDDTLLDFGKAESVAFKKMMSKLELEVTEDIVNRYSNINAEQWKLLEEKKITREKVLVRRFEILFSELGVEKSAQEAKETYEKLLGKGHYFVPGAVEVLKRLSDEYNLYIVSNGTASVQDGRIESSGIAKYFKDIFISQRVGFDKPHIEFFEKCFSNIPGFLPKETIIIGDSLTSDIRGGNNAGIYTCWFNPKRKAVRQDITADYEITQLAQIPDLLKKIV